MASFAPDDMFSLIHKYQINCPTCLTKFKNKQSAYEEKMDNICKNFELSFEEMDLVKRNAFNDLELNYCCRMRIINLHI
jgi:hypothetical protein